MVHLKYANKHTFWYLCALFPGNVDESPQNEEAAEEKGWIAQFVGEHSTAWEVLQAQKANSNVKQMAKNRNQTRKKKKKKKK